MKYLVVGGTGTVGSDLVAKLTSAGEQVGVLTRHGDKAKNLPTGATAVVGDLMDPTSVSKIFNGVENVFLLNAVSTTELHEGLSAVWGARHAGVKKMVYLSVHNADQAWHVPHFGAKVVVENALKSSGMTWTILRPNNFFQNDVWFKDAITKYGVYPQPMGDIGISRVDIRDIGLAAFNALTKTGFEGQTFTLAGPHPLNGNATAEILSKHLGKKINFAGNDLNAWERQALTSMPSWMVWDFKLMYKHFQDKGLIATHSELERQKKLLGRDPMTYDNFVGELAKLWK
ncbi:MAG: NmrA family NAD(P)-binding protein [Myxococcota bacterium]